MGRVVRKDNKIFINATEVIGVTSRKLINILVNENCKFMGIAAEYNDNSRSVLYFEKTEKTLQLIETFRNYKN